MAEELQLPILYDRESHAAEEHKSSLEWRVLRSI